VRFVCSKAYRIKRLATIFNVEEQQIERKLEDFNLKQRYFYKKVYQLEKASTQEFDLVINCDYIKDPQWAAEIVEENFRKKFSIRT
jgi:cytidylate kinase